MSDQKKILKYSLEKYIEETNPAGKLSRLTPYKDEIIALLSRGYSQKQVCEFLARNEVQISPAGLAKFIGTIDSHGRQPTRTSQATKHRTADQPHNASEPTIFRVQQTPKVNPADYDKRNKP